ncbi:twin-arginine translocase subunit TatC [Streptomyces sp. NBC_00083]|uniref:twin-arginine translocase subunit TatC n=1 Tax=Streptomyces sp. NBC_00083 TaxID=2975647 RepID=UPI002258A2EA|nr:twin-arginine translocase subunit TatC [Streptomyces sp. NBC_00083]MCX5383447.1 twin-arginine translocase subunit TatC [Streptomyces sp. NBC_00083]
MLKSARNQQRDPEGRMPLSDHLRELRNRLAKAVLAILVCAIVAAFYYKDIAELITKPIKEAVDCTVPFTELTAKDGAKVCGNITMSGLMGPFTLMIKVSLVTGVVAASPVWLYQLWAFVAPGLHKHEKRYSLSFVAAGFPLFVAGGWFSYHVLPAAAEVLLGFTPAGVANLLPLNELIDLVTRMIIVFGLSFELPLFLVMLNFSGILTGRRMLGWWRGMIMGVTVFAAFATPTVDPVSMLSLAAPIVALYFVAVGISMVNDKRRKERAESGPADDEASDLDLTPEAVGAIEPVTSPPALPEQSDGGRGSKLSGYDDVT